MIKWLKRKVFGLKYRNVSVGISPQKPGMPIRFEVPETPRAMFVEEFFNPETDMGKDIKNNMIRVFNLLDKEETNENTVL